MPVEFKWNSQPTSGLQCCFSPIAGFVPACFYNSCTWACTDNKGYNSKSRMVCRPIYILFFLKKTKKNKKSAPIIDASPLLNSRTSLCEMNQKSPSLRWMLDFQEDLGELSKVVFGSFKYTRRMVWVLCGFRLSFSFFCWCPLILIYRLCHWAW